MYEVPDSHTYTYEVRSTPYTHILLAKSDVGAE